MLLVLLLPAVLGVTGASASGIRVAPVSAGEAGAFWSPNRMKAAQPLEVSAPRVGSVAPRAAELGHDF
ncbi:MAG TPA: hypothetical protein VIJ36_19165, partial [Thermoanaerobaculia bacterium]